MTNVLTETVFRSDEIPAPERFDAWRELMSRTHAPLRLESECAADFRAHQRLIELGPVSIWPATFQQLVFIRTPRLISQSDPEVHHLSLILDGEAGVTWGRRENTYRPFDFHTNDSSRPYRIWTGHGLISSIGIEIPKALLPLPPSRVDQVIGRHLSGREGIGTLLTQFLTQISADTSAYRPADGPRLGTVLVDLVAAMFAQSLEAEAALAPETRTRALTLRIKSYIQQHLHDAELTPSRIAAAHHVSRGYLHRLFKDEAETVAAFIRGRRLDGARRDLADPALAATPVHVIAARWGFPRAADFSRAFRAAHGVPPTEYRSRAVPLSTEPVTAQPTSAVDASATRPATPR